MFIDEAKKCFLDKISDFEFPPSGAYIIEWEQLGVGRSTRRVYNNW